MSKYSQNKDINCMVKQLIKEGWEPLRKNRHLMIKSPKGVTLTVPISPSDGRAVLNFKADIRRAT
jgi:hypothetical protein